MQSTYPKDERRKSMNILRGYRTEEAKAQMENGKLFDFLPTIRQNGVEDQAVLHRWEQYLTDLDVPYIVTQDGTIQTLWKRVVL